MKVNAYGVTQLSTLALSVDALKWGYRITAGGILFNTLSCTVSIDNTKSLLRVAMNEHYSSTRIFLLDAGCFIYFFI